MSGWLCSVKRCLDKSLSDFRWIARFSFQTTLYWLMNHKENLVFHRKSLWTLFCTLLQMFYHMFLTIIFASFHRIGKSKHIPAPPPRASSHTISRESSLKYSQTLQRESPRGVKRDISQQYHTQTLPVPSSKQKQRLLTDSPTPLSSSSSASSGSHASVKYEGLFVRCECFYINNRPLDTMSSNSASALE